MSMYSRRQWQFVHTLYSSGYTLGELADWLGVHRETIRRAFHQYELCTPVHSEKEPLDKYREHFNKLAGEE